MDRDYGLKYRNLYENHWWWRARECAILTRFEAISSVGEHRILDIGCGDGLFFDKLSAFGDVHGVEVNRQLVSPDNPHRDRIHVGPFDDSYQPGRQFSVILMLDVLEHLPDPGTFAALGQGVARSRRPATDHRARVSLAVDKSRRPERTLHKVRPEQHAHVMLRQRFRSRE